MKKLQNPSQAKATRKQKPPRSSQAIPQAKPEPIQPEVTETVQETPTRTPQVKPTPASPSLPKAPDPKMEMMTETSAYSVCDEDRSTISNIQLNEPDSDDEETPEGVAPGMMPDGLPMTREEFAEFWGVGVFDLIAAAGDIPLINKNLNPVAVPPERQPKAIKAGEQLYKVTERFPKALGWMRSPMAAATGEIGACVMFFGSQFMTLAICLQQPSAGEEVPDHERG